MKYMMCPFLYSPCQESCLKVAMKVILISCRISGLLVQITSLALTKCIHLQTFLSDLRIKARHCLINRLLKLQNYGMTLSTMTSKALYFLQDTERRKVKGDLGLQKQQCQPEWKV